MITEEKLRQIYARNYPYYKSITFTHFKNAVRDIFMQLEIDNETKVVKVDNRLNEIAASLLRGETKYSVDLLHLKTRLFLYGK